MSPSQTCYIAAATSAPTPPSISAVAAWAWISQLAAAFVSCATDSLRRHRGTRGSRQRARQDGGGMVRMVLGVEEAPD
ncbi:hypothetical protein EDB87DRAFT_1648742 [Lactarius vividus]|nr:hypothetical protein EDB87DRAFT_1648742 [Lactarius vividus]